MLENLLFNTFVFAGCLFTYVTIVFILAQLKRDNSVMDIAYGPAFFCSALATTFFINPSTTVAYGVLIGIGVWATRLALRIGRKNWGKPEDARYAAWRTQWMERGYGYFLLRSYLQVNLLQGLVILAVAFPFIIAVSASSNPSLWWLLAGGSIYMFGLLYESIADWQLDQFLARKRAGTEPATLMITGLFGYSRRPNYFGETLIWWGLAVAVFPLPYGWVAIISPLVITYIVTQVTGPMLEKIFIEKYPTEYSEYQKTTNYFIPNFFK